MTLEAPLFGAPLALLALAACPADRAPAQALAFDAAGDPAHKP